MTFYYAPGGGQGHFMRAHKVLSHFEIKDAIIFGSILPPFQTQIPYLKLPNLEQIPDYINQLISHYQPDTIFIDTFPWGINGEVLEFENLQNRNLFYIARLLNTKYFENFKSRKFFQKTFKIENLTSNHLQIINEISLSNCDLKLNHFIENQMITKIDLPKNFWAVVHSGPEDEVDLILKYAMLDAKAENFNGEILIFTTCDYQSDFQVLNLNNLENVYQKATRIYSAAGFNVFWETESFRNKQKFLPMERNFDLQFERVSLNLFD